MDDNADDGADDGFSMDELTGWSDCDCTMGSSGYDVGLTMQDPVEPAVKKPRAKSGALRKPIQKTGPRGLVLPSPTKDTPTASAQRRLALSHSELLVTRKATTDSFSSPTSVLLDVDGPSSASPYKSVSLAPSSAAGLAPMMILPVQEKTSPLAKPFTIHKYTNFQQQKPQQSHHTPVQFHVVTTPTDDDAQPPNDRLPPLMSLRDALGAPSAKPTPWGFEESTFSTQVTSEPRKQSTQCVQPAASIKMQWTMTTQKHRHCQVRTSVPVPQKAATVNKKQLVKNDKPTVWSHMTHGSSSRRYSDVGKRSHNTQRIAQDSGYLSKALYAPRRQSVCGNESLLGDDETQLNEWNDDLDENSGDTAGLLRTLTQFSSSPGKALGQAGDRHQHHHSSKYRSAVP